MPVQTYGWPSIMPLEADFVTYSNEDIGFTADLTTGTNENIKFAMPLPASLDLFSETVIWHSFEFMLGSPGAGTGTTHHGLQAYFSMLDDTPTATFRGTLADVDDAWWKSQFAGPMYFGNDQRAVTAVAAVEGQERTMDGNIIAQYTPPVPIDATSPLQVTFANASTGYVLATNAAAPATFSIFEQVSIRAWFTIRDLDAMEMRPRNMAVRFQRLDS